MDRKEEIKVLQRCGSADWALVMRALVSGGKGPIGAGYLLEKLEGAKARSCDILDSTRRQEYFRLKLEHLLLEEKRKANEKAAAIVALEACRNFGGWT